MAISTRELLLVLRARDEASKVLRGAAADINGVSGAAASAAQKQLQAGAAMTTVGVAVAYAGFKALDFMNDATNAAIEYNRQSALTLTQTDKLHTSLQEIKDIGRDVAVAVPTDFKKIQDSLYDIFSSMDVTVPQAKNLLTQFGKASVAGQVDLQEASRATIGILNAYQQPAESVNAVNDIMFQLVRKGVGTYGEFASTIGRAVPSAVRAGQTVSDLAGMMAFLTRNGLSAAMASASAGRALDAISNPKTIDHFNALGKTVEKVAGKGKAIEIFGKNYASAGVKIVDASGHIRPMSAIMTDLGKAIGNLPDAQRAAVLQELFKSSGGTIQARRFFDEAVKGYGQLNSLTQSMINSKGAMEEAYQTMLDTPAMKLKLLSNRWEVLKTVIGDALLPVKMFITEGISKLLGWFEKLSPAVQKTIIYIAAIAAVVAVVVGIAVAIAGIGLMLSAAAALAGTTIAAILIPIGWIVLAIVAITAAVFLAWKYHEQLWAIAKQVWNAIKPIVEPVWQAIKLAASIIKDYFLAALKETWKHIKEAFEPTMKSLKEAWDQLKTSLSDIWQSLQPIMPALKVIGIVLGVIVVGAVMAVIAAFIIVVNFVAGVLAPVIKMLADVFKGVFEVIAGLVKFFVGLVTLNFSMMGEGLKQIVGGLWDIIKGIFTGAINIVVGAVKGLWNGVVSVFKAAYDVLVGHSIVPDLINGIVQWFLGLPGRVLKAIAGLASALGTWAYNALINAYNAFIGVGNTIVTWAGGLVRSIVSAISGLASSLFTAGWNALTSLYDGAKQAGQKVLDYVGGIAKKVRDLWPFSPAKAGPLRQYPMNKAGENLMKMLSAGIESKRDLVLSSMKNIAYDVSQVQTGAPVVSASGGGPGGNGSGGAGTTQNFYIETQEIDPTKHAADLGWELARRRG